MRRFSAILLVTLLAACPDGTLVQAEDKSDDPATVDGDGGVQQTEDPPDASTTPPVEMYTPEETVPEQVADPRTGPPYPIVLAHGLNGFRDVGPLDYFFRVPAALEEAGHQVFVTAVAPYNGSASRARLLAEQIDAILAQTGARKVNIIAHSQGGLDSRYLISTLGYGDRIATLTTVSTPHLGSAVADAILDNEFPAELDIINGYASLFGAAAADAENDADARAALETLHTANATAFNHANPDDPRVVYFSFAGRTNLQRADDECAGEWPNPDAVDGAEVALLGTWTLLAGSLTEPKANDGLVTVASAKWGRFMGCIPADHLDEIGQIADLIPDLISGWDHVDFYRRWANELRTMGY
ncbi:MAG: triacylglycerol lipase [Myxococcota bacterium]